MRDSIFLDSNIFLYSFSSDDEIKHDIASIIVLSQNGSVRNFNILENYEYVEIEDKKTHVLKGLFVSAELIDDVKAFLDAKLAADKQKKLDALMPFVGMVNGEFDTLTPQEIKSMKKEKYRGE